MAPFTVETALQLYPSASTSFVLMPPPSRMGLRKTCAALKYKLISSTKPVVTTLGKVLLEISEGMLLPHMISLYLNCWLAANNGLIVFSNLYKASRLGL